MADFSPIVIQKTLTDGDGRFSITYPRGQGLAVFAKAKRLVSNRTEKYCWLIDAPDDVNAAQIFLSNDNFVSIDPDDYFGAIKPCKASFRGLLSQ